MFELKYCRDVYRIYVAYIILTDFPTCRNDFYEIALDYWGSEMEAGYCCLIWYKYMLNLVNDGTITEIDGVYYPSKFKE